MKNEKEFDWGVVAQFCDGDSLDPWDLPLPPGLIIPPEILLEEERYLREKKDL